MNTRALSVHVLALTVSISLSLASPAGAERYVVSPANMQGWVIGIQQGVNGGWDPPYVPQPAEMPIADFVYGPGQPPAGDGSLHMQVFYSDNDPLSKVYIGTNAFSGIELKRITKLKYCTYVQYRDYDRSMPPMVELITDSGITVQQRRFWFYPWGERRECRSERRRERTHGAVAGVGPSGSGRALGDDIHQHFQLLRKLGVAPEVV